MGRQMTTAAIPECGTPGHGPMEQRDLGTQTYEQMWCGVWYDCTHPRCRSSVLIKSPELIRAEKLTVYARGRDG